MVPHLDSGEASVGVLVNVTHTAPTPPGMEVTVQVRCVGVNGQHTKWEIEAMDEGDVTGKGTHERFTIDAERFDAKVAEKAKAR